jgi:ADP-ribosylglycohydrolase
MVDALAGCLIGTAVGDAVGLPAEGCSRARIDRHFPRPWRHRLVGRWGMCSDDTEHAFFVAQALLSSAGDVERFRRCLAWKLRWWFLSLPAGVGKATALACLRLWLGWPATRAGIHSAGNGPAMRAPLIGAVFANDPKARLAHLDASTALTHRDPKARIGAQAIADLAAAWTADPVGGTPTIEHFIALGEDTEWTSAMEAVAQGLADGVDARSMADRLDLERGVSGYILHTVPMVLFAACRYGDDPEEALEQMWSCGGDVDTTGAILGGLLGIRHGPEAFPRAWRHGIHNGPLSLALLKRVADALQEENGKPVRWWWPLVPLRNLLFLLIVLAHGFRRLSPW